MHNTSTIIQLMTCIPCIPCTLTFLFSTECGLCARVGVTRLRARITSKSKQTDVDSRIGAFEVQVAFKNSRGEIYTELLHSKLLSRHWPNRSALERKLKAFVLKSGVGVHPLYDPNMTSDGFGSEGLGSYPVGFVEWEETPLADATWVFPVTERSAVLAIVAPNPLDLLKKIESAKTGAVAAGNASGSGKSSGTGVSEKEVLEMNPSPSASALRVLRRNSMLIELNYNIANIEDIESKSLNVQWVFDAREVPGIIQPNVVYPTNPTPTPSAPTPSVPPKRRPQSASAVRPNGVSGSSGTAQPTEKVEKGEKGEKGEKSEKGDNRERIERVESRERSDSVGRGDKGAVLARLNSKRISPLNSEKSDSSMGGRTSEKSGKSSKIPKSPKSPSSSRKNSLQQSIPEQLKRIVMRNIIKGREDEPLVSYSYKALGKKGIIASETIASCVLLRQSVITLCSSSITGDINNQNIEDRVNIIFQGLDQRKTGYLNVRDVETVLTLMQNRKCSELASRLVMLSLGECRFLLFMSFICL